MEENRFTRRERSYIMMSVVGIVTVGQLSAGIYLPSMRAMAAAMQVSADTIQLTLPLYYLGYGLSLFVYGPLADRYGRRIISFIGIVIFLLGGSMSALAPNAFALIAGCALQGLGMGASGMLWRTIPRDMYHGRTLLQTNAWFGAVSMLMPFIAPIIGGYLQLRFGWQANFIFLTCYCLCWFIVSIPLLKETKPLMQSASTVTESTLKSYQNLCLRPAYILPAMASFAQYGIFSAYEVGAALILPEILHVSTTSLGWYLATPFVGYATGAMFVRQQMRISQQTLCYFGTLLMFAGGIALLMVDLLWGPSLGGFLFPLTLLFMGLGMVYPVVISLAMETLSVRIALGGSLLGAVQNLGAFFAGITISHLHEKSSIPLACVLLVLCSIHLLCMVSYFAREKHS